MLELITSAQAVGFSAKYILFDSWFSSLKTLISLKEKCHTDAIALIKKDRTKYLYEGQNLNIERIYSKDQKRRGHSKCLLSVNVTLEKNDEALLAGIVCVRNKSNRKGWLALVSIGTNLSEEELIRVYGKCWDIEVFFRSCKSYLKLVKGCRSVPYDALNTHVVTAFTRYMLLSVAKR